MLDSLKLKVTMKSLNLWFCTYYSRPQSLAINFCSSIINILFIKDIQRVFLWFSEPTKKEKAIFSIEPNTKTGVCKGVQEVENLKIFVCGKSLPENSQWENNSTFFTWKIDNSRKDGRIKKRKKEKKSGVRKGKK